jgi:DNA-binding NarL/FixJ family response regulator
VQSPRSLTLLIVDKESSGRPAFAQPCRRANDLHVVGEAEWGGAALDAVESPSPDVMLIDVRLLVRLLERRPKNSGG